MYDVPILEDLVDIVENKYIAANMAAKRARWLNEKKRLPTIKTDAIKETTIALEELFANKLDYRPVQPEEESRKIEELIPSPASDEEEVEEVSEQLFEEEYVDDRNIVVEDEEPEEGI
ncbi:MAG: DNA-directed RNA polymerase subunit omega [Candidatus Poribacteria bacterium]